MMDCGSRVDSRLFGEQTESMRGCRRSNADCSLRRDQPTRKRRFYEYGARASVHHKQVARAPSGPVLESTMSLASDSSSRLSK